MPEIDPAGAQRRAMEQLTAALMRVDEHLLALEQPTQERMLARERTSASLGQLPESALTEKFVSQAWVPPDMPKSGELGEHGSRSYFDPETQATLRRRQSGGVSLPPGMDLGEGKSPIRGLNPEEANEMEREPIRIPQFGDWQLDAMLKLASQAAGIRAIKQAAKRSDAGEDPLLPDEQGALSAGNVSGFLNQAASVATYGSAIHRRVFSPLAQHAFAGQEQGAALGYSPQDSPIGGQFIMGVKNPLAALTSSAGQQGMGQKLNAIGSVLGGGISMEQATGLRNALSAEGFSNQESGFLGLTQGGENENLANTLEGVTKEGVNPNIAAGFANSVRYGSGTIHELQKALQGMGDTAKTLKFGINETAEAMQSYAKEMESQGGTPIRSFEHFKEIAGATGLPPETIAAVNQSPVAVAIGASKGVFPGTLGSQSGPMQIQTAIKAVNQMTAGGGHDVTEENPWTGKTEVSQSAEEQALAKAIAVYGLHVSVPQLKAMKEHGDQMIASSHVVAAVKGQQDILAHLPGFHEEELETEINNRKAFVKQADSEQKGLGSNSIQAEEIREKEKALKGFKAHGLTDRERAEAKNNFYDLWTNKTTGQGLDKETGISRAEFGKDYALDKGGPKALAALNKQLEEKSKIKTEQAEGKGVIDLSPRAKEFFELHFPNQLAENARSGGKSTASSAADVSQGKNAKGESFASEALHSTFGAASKAVKGDEIGAVEEFF